ncbi:MAG: hypothetical protein GX060_09430 [Firmicutes bacterium]|nr:hypothetical protein [Bacillota bacterium]
MGDIVRVVELTSYQQQGRLLPAMREAVQTLRRTDTTVAQKHLCDVALSRVGSRLYIHFYFEP